MELLLPFKIGDLAEYKCFQAGYRGAWFRCKVWPFILAFRFVQLSYLVCIYFSMFKLVIFKLSLLSFHVNMIFRFHINIIFLCRTMHLMKHKWTTSYSLLKFQIYKNTTIIYYLSILTCNVCMKHLIVFFLTMNHQLTFPCCR